MELIEIINNIVLEDFTRMIFSKPGQKAEHKKIVITKNKTGYSSEAFTEKQAFRKTVEQNNILKYLCTEAKNYLQINAWTKGFEHIILISKKGHISYKKKKTEKTTNNLTLKKKNFPIPFSFLVY